MGIIPLSQNAKYFLGALENGKENTAYKQVVAFSGKNEDEVKRHLQIACHQYLNYDYSILNRKLKKIRKHDKKTKLYEAMKKLHDTLKPQDSKKEKDVLFAEIETCLEKCLKVKSGIGSLTSFKEVRKSLENAKKVFASQTKKTTENENKKEKKLKILANKNKS